LPATILQIASGERVLKLGALHPTRDFNYVADTVRGFIAVAESDRSVGHVINIGSNYEISIADAVRLIASLMGAEVTIETEAQRLRPAKSEVERLLADNTRAREMLGWTPQFGGLDGLSRGLGETIDWFTRPENLARYKAGIYNL
jgi:dTDP-glucose 4,6-dehydratase